MYKYIYINVYIYQYISIYFVLISIVFCVQELTTLLPYPWCARHSYQCDHCWISNHVLFHSAHPQSISCSEHSLLRHRPHHGFLVTVWHPLCTACCFTDSIVFCRWRLRCPSSGDRQWLACLPVAPGNLSDSVFARPGFSFRSRAYVRLGVQNLGWTGGAEGFVGDIYMHPGTVCYRKMWRVRSQCKPLFAGMPHCTMRQTHQVWCFRGIYESWSCSSLRECSLLFLHVSTRLSRCILSCVCFTRVLPHTTSAVLVC